MDDEQRLADLIAALAPAPDGWVCVPAVPHWLGGSPAASPRRTRVVRPKTAHELMRILHLDAGREMRGGQWQVLRLIDALDDHDDVQEVYANFDVSDEVMEALDA